MEDFTKQIQELVCNTEEQVIKMKSEKDENER
jgi:hypothetical protein